MSDQIDRKVLDKIRKLINLANDGAATEGEASSALEKAREIMAANNLSMAQLEASGKSGGDGANRLATGVKGKAMYKYQQSLMSTIAATNFCAVIVVTSWNGHRHTDTGYTLIGRESNVAAVINMFDYLNKSLERIVTPHLDSNAQRLSRWAVSFKEGASQRLSERLRDRYREEMAAQSAKARAERDAHANSGHNSSSGAVIVVMEDFAQSEQDANNDKRMGWEPGETATRRARAEASAAEYRRREDERRESLTEEERLAEDAAQEKDYAKWEKKWNKSSERYWAKRDITGYMKGREEANKIGLDDQVDKQSATAIK